MTASGRPAPAIPCHNPRCSNVIAPHSGSGRPRKYCDDSCRRDAYRKSTRQPSPEDLHHTDIVQQLALDLMQSATAVRDLATREASSHEGLQDQSFRLLQQVDRLAQDVDMLRAASVQQARDRDVKLRQIARLWNLTTSQISRAWPANSIDRRMRSRDARRRTDPLTTSTGTTPPARRPGTATGPQEPEHSPDEPTAAADALHTFARAMSYLQRASGVPYKQLAKAAGVHRSYVYRVLAGERCPSWAIARDIIQAAGGDTSELRPLWAAAHDALHATPRHLHHGTLQAALRGLYLAACAPPLDTIRYASRGGLTAGDIKLLLHEESTPPGWNTVHSLVHALGGQPETIRPLWEATQSQAGHRTPAASTVTTVLAESFG